VVRLTNDHALLTKPRKNVIAVVVSDADGLRPVALGLTRHDTERVADFSKRVFQVRVDLGEHGCKLIFVRLQVDRAGDAEVTHGIAGAWVGVTCGRDRLNRRAKLGL
jgi:hypothetical protein